MKTKTLSFKYPSDTETYLQKPTVIVFTEDAVGFEGINLEKTTVKEADLRKVIAESNESNCLLNLYLQFPRGEIGYRRYLNRKVTNLEEVKNHA